MTAGLRRIGLTACAVTCALGALGAGVATAATTADRWVPVAQHLVTPGFYAAAAPLPGGRVLLAGGDDDNTQETTSAEVYDSATGDFTPTGSLNVARRNAVAAPLPDGEVLVAGGFAAGHSLTSAELYDPETGAFTLLAATLPSSLNGVTAALLGNDTVLIPTFGAMTIYHPVTRTFTGAAYRLRVTLAGAKRPTVIASTLRIA
ncbi:MAG TPA: kelch repeat-containing protein [Baekduia sp.]|jgi:hypothetical protein